MGSGGPKRAGITSGAIAFSVAAGRGGKGSVWIDEISFDQREPSNGNDQMPAVGASSALPGHEAALVFDSDPQTSWRSEPVTGPQWLLIDLLRERDYGGLVIDWAPDEFATSYRVLVSRDGESWDPAFSVAQGNGNRDYIYLPDGESRYIKLDLQESSRGQGYGIVNVEVKPFEFSASTNRFFEALAREAAPGTYPKYLTGKQTYWTVVGVNGDPKEALLNEEGMLEVEENGFSIEPFLYLDGRLLTWNSVQTRQELADGYLPIPSVIWEDTSVRLTVTAFAAGEPWLSNLYARYRVTNKADDVARGTPVSGSPPFPGEPALAVSEAFRRYHADPQSASRRGKGGGERGEGRSRAHSCERLRGRCFRAGAGHGFPSEGNLAGSVGRAGPIRLRVRGLRIRPGHTSSRGAGLPAGHPLLWLGSAPRVDNRSRERPPGRVRQSARQNKAVLGNCSEPRCPLVFPPKRRE